jgi:5'-methylthioadenosine phosphorylase/purine-nucleoside phosphorylase
MPIHLRGEPSDYAEAVLVPGDPRRARHIAETFFDPGARCVNEERGMLGFTGTFNGKPISVQSVGMGGPSAAIYYSELIQLGAKRLIRVGTAGGLQRGLKMGDTLIALSGTSDDTTVSMLTQGLPIAPTATYGLVEQAVALARQQGVSLHVGGVVSSGLFYDPRPGLMQRWRELGHLGVEMEVAVLYTLAAIHGIESVALMTVSDLIDDDGSTERISDEQLRAGVDQMMRIGCEVATCTIVT